MKPIIPKNPPAQLSLLDQARQQAADKKKFWNPAPNDGVEGTLVRISHGGKFNSNFYHLKTDDEIIIVPASPSTILGKELAALNLEIGDRVAIVFLGEATSKDNRRFKDWSIVAIKPERQMRGAQRIFGEES
jgi:hypothetical protein